MTSTAAAQGGMMLTSFNQPLVPNEDWRASGLAYVELPLRIRASFDASYRQHGTLSDRLASPLVNDVGPGIISDETLESRISFTRPITERIEIEVAWLTSNRLTTSDPMGFGAKSLARSFASPPERLTPASSSLGTPKSPFPLALQPSGSASPCVLLLACGKAI